MILSLGIGSNLAVFDLADALFLRALPYRDSSQIAHITAAFTQQANLDGCLSYPHWRMLAGSRAASEAFAGYTQESFNLLDSGRATQLQAGRVSANFFNVLGVEPTAGRAFRADEDVPGQSAVVMLSYRIWQERWRGSPGVIGQSLNLNARPYTIVGILPAWFRFAPLGTRTDLWTPSLTELNMLTPEQVQGGSCYINAVARVSRNSTFSKLEAGLLVRNRQFLREYRELGDADPRRPLEVLPLEQKIVSGYRTNVLALMSAVTLLLVIACANVGGLLAARATDRRRDFAVRLALGATRAQIAAQVVSESLWLCLLGGFGGALFACIALFSSASVIARFLPALEGSSLVLDWRIALFAVALALATALLCSLTPIANLSRTDLNPALKAQGRSAAGVRHGLWREGLVAGQIALSTLLVLASGLLIHSFVRLTRQPLGFDPAGVLTMNVSLAPARYPTAAQAAAFFDRTLAALSSLPGVQQVALASALPLNESRLAHVMVEGRPPVPIAQRPLAAIQSVSPGYIRSLQIPLLAGRFLGTFDRAGGRRVAVINQTFAKQFFGSTSALGKHIYLGRKSEPWEIVGVIGDIKNLSLAAAPQAEFDVSFWQLPSTQLNILIRGSGNINPLPGAVRSRISQIDGQQPLTNAQTLDELLADSVAEPRTIMVLLSGFAAMAFALALAGVYSLVSYGVARRLAEFGVRMALGSTRSRLFRLVLGRAVKMAAAGTLTGALASFGLSRLISHLTFGIALLDPLTFCLVLVLFPLAVLLAASLPAWRAAHLPPAAALRNE